VIYFLETTAVVQLSSQREKKRSDKMNSQSKQNKAKLDSGVDPIVLTLSDLSHEVKKNSANETVYIDHL
jgi:hypothetical protein